MDAMAAIKHSLPELTKIKHWNEYFYSSYNKLVVVVVVVVVLKRFFIVLQK